MAHKVAEILRRGRGAAHQQLGHDDGAGSHGPLVVFFEVREDFGGCGVEFEEGEEDGVDLCCQFAGGRDYDG